MALLVEFRDACVIGNYGQYVSAPTTATSAGNGRGGRAGQQYNGIYAKVAVSSQGEKGIHTAWKIEGGTPGQYGHSYSFVEGSTQHVTLMITSDGHLKAYRGSSAGTLLATSVNVLFALGDYPSVEAKVVVHDTTGSIAVKINEVLVTWDLPVINIDTRNGGTGTIDQVWWGTLLDNGHMCDIVILKATSDWLGDRVVLYSPAATAGTFTDGVATGAASLLLCVNESAGGFDGDTKYIAQNDTGLPKAATFGITAAPGNVTQIIDVAPVSLCRKDDAGTDNCRGLLKSGATTDDGGVDVAVIPTYTNVFGQGSSARHYQTDPNTSAAWVIANFNAIEIGRRRVA